ncbi:MAG: MOSC domain-containing protein [Candidatus Sumerlaeaceae bacterium]|nr:MOSC domain-containing protein [Candidatus Sumerlaeaceae bacterium]
MSKFLLQSIQVGLPQERANAAGRVLRSAIWKDPVLGPVRLTCENLEGDKQADLRYHGGPDKAVCCFPSEHFALLSEFVGQRMAGGAIGENFTFSGLTEDGVCLGDQYQIGEILVEVSQPRQPCSSLAHKWDSKSLPGRMIDLNTTGWYSRVIREGIVEAPAPAELLARPHPEWTITRLNEIMYRDKHNVELLTEALRIPQLSAAWRQDFAHRLQEAKAKS